MREQVCAIVYAEPLLDSKKEDICAEEVFVKLVV